MKFRLPNGAQDDFYTSSQLSGGEPAIPHAEVFVLASNSGRTSLQERQGDSHAIRLKNSQMKMPGTVPLHTEHPTIAFCYVMKGHATWQLNGVGDTVFREGYYHLYYLPRGEYSLSIHKGNCTILMIELHVDFLKRAALKYAELREVCERVAAGSELGIQQIRGRMTTDVKAVLKKMIQCDFHEPEWSTYFTSRLNDLLLIYMRLFTVERAALPKSYTEEDIKNLDALAEMEHDEQPNEEQLSRLFAMNKRKLRDGFKLRNKKGRRELNVEKKIKEACRMLRETTFKVCKIAYMLGYKSLPSFGKIFRKITGKSPGKFRK
ncbi:AraC family transcriptional regulator [uncultured Chitinophaga sp.]|uniref:helix-turn-helix domain-containing protein n=1 Tax=uncultured Chitinophaga sp. TaxID=339340 RepID=UPI0025FA32A3|nr:AraC family transcriptional regulator [uncultured Chitinophaga sp.]